MNTNRREAHETAAGLMNSHPYQLVALDADGTLLDEHGHVTPDMRRALRHLESSGIPVVICTGRRFRRASDVARMAEMTGPIVCNSGALVKHACSHETLWRADLPHPTLSPLFELLRESDKHAVCFSDNQADHDFFVAQYPSRHEHFNEYVTHNHDHVLVNPEWKRTALRGEIPVFHLCVVGTHDEMLEFQAMARTRHGRQLQTFVQRTPRYAGWMCELLRGDANKWTALRTLADSWRILPERIVAVGDDQNDLAMIAGAGLGVAMSHAPDNVRAVANRILDSSRPMALARFLFELAEPGRIEPPSPRQ